MDIPSNAVCFDVFNSGCVRNHKFEFAGHTENRLVGVHYSFQTVYHVGSHIGFDKGFSFV